MMTTNDYPTENGTEIKPDAVFKQKLIQLLGSRKFWAALLGLILIVVKGFEPSFPIEEDALTNIIYLLVAYILGTAIEDSGMYRS